MWQLLNVNDGARPRVLSHKNDGLANLSDRRIALAAEEPETAPFRYTAPNISSYAMSAHTMADIGFGAILDVKTEGDVFYYVIDVSAYTDKVDVQLGADDKTLILTRWGIGFRIAIVAWHIDVKATANLGMVAASTQLGAGQSSLIAHAFAADVSKLGRISEIMKYNSEKFDAQMLKNLAEFVGQLTSLIASKGSEIAPAAVKYGVLNPNQYNPDHIVASNSFAIEQLARGEPRSGLDNWTAGRNHDDWRNNVFSPVVISAAYENFGVPNYNGRGTDEQRKAADTLKRLGD
jgi:hypothetical protein